MDPVKVGLQIQHDLYFEIEVRYFFQADDDKRNGESIDATPQTDMSEIYLTMSNPHIYESISSNMNLSANQELEMDSISQMEELCSKYIV